MNYMLDKLLSGWFDCHLVEDPVTLYLHCLTDLNARSRKLAEGDKNRKQRIASSLSRPKGTLPEQYLDQVGNLNREWIWMAL